MRLPTAHNMSTHHATKKVMTAVILLMMFLNYYSYTTTHTSITSHSISKPLITEISYADLYNKNSFYLSNIIYNLLLKITDDPLQSFHILPLLLYILFMLTLYLNAALRLKPPTSLLVIIAASAVPMFLSEIHELNFHAEQSIVLMLMFFCYTMKEKIKSKKHLTIYLLLFIYSLAIYNNFIIYGSVFVLVEIISFIKSQPFALKKENLSRLLAPAVMTVYFFYNIDYYVFYLSSKLLPSIETKQADSPFFSQETLREINTNILSSVNLFWYVFFVTAIVLTVFFIIHKKKQKEKTLQDLLPALLGIIPIAAFIIAAKAPSAYLQVHYAAEASQMADIIPALTMMILLFIIIFDNFTKTFNNKIQTILSISLVLMLFYNYNTALQEKHKSFKVKLSNQKELIEDILITLKVAPDAKIFIINNTYNKEEDSQFRFAMEHLHTDHTTIKSKQEHTRFLSTLKTHNSRKKIFSDVDGKQLALVHILTKKHNQE